MKGRRTMTMTDRTKSLYEPINRVGDYLPRVKVSESIFNKMKNVRKKFEFFENKEHANGFGFRQNLVVKLEKKYLIESRIQVETPKFDCESLRFRITSCVCKVCVSHSEW